MMDFLKNGVSMTGQYDCKASRDPKILAELKAYAVTINKEFAKRFGINESSSVTTIKPEGTVSEIVNASPGMHPRYSEFYLRRVRMNASDPLFHLLRDQGVKWYPEVGQTRENATTFVVEMPKKSSAHSVKQSEITAIDLLKHWLVNKTCYTEHNPSCTINYDPDEAKDVGNFVWNNWEKIGGLSFFPKTNVNYALAPIEPITEEQYLEELKYINSLNLDLSKLVHYEVDDEHIDHRREPACAGGQCLYSP